MKVTVTLGTRPEIIKMAPIIKQCLLKGMELRVVHTNQHSSYEMSEQFFVELQLPAPDVNLTVEPYGKRIDKICSLLKHELISWKPDIVLAEGDTNTVLAAALTAKELQIPFGHVEAGLRAFEKTMPEEINRIAADHCADYCFAPTEVSKNNLLNEGIQEHVIHVTGNTVVDACREYIGFAERESNIIERLCLEEPYMVATIHRASNIDDVNGLQEIISGLDEVDAPIVFPVHPHTLKEINRYGLRFGKNIIASKPLGYLDFLKLLAHARLVITDSGGVQEEASILEIPCVTVRDSTERPETVIAGVNMLVKPDEITRIVNNILYSDETWRSMRGKPDLYGTGDSAERIVNIIEGQP